MVGGVEVGEVEDYIPIAAPSHQNDSCIKMGSDESHFNVSVTVRNKVIRQRPQTTTFCGSGMVVKEPRRDKERGGGARLT